MAVVGLGGERICGTKGEGVAAEGTVRPGEGGVGSVAANSRKSCAEEVGGEEIGGGGGGGEE